jgi:hypothetical protein
MAQGSWQLLWCARNPQVARLETLALSKKGGITVNRGDMALFALNTSRDFRAKISDSTALFSNPARAHELSTTHDWSLSIVTMKTMAGGQ